MIKAITYILENDSNVASLVGNNAANDKTKVYPVVVPSSEKAPYIAVRMTSRSLLAKGCSFLYGFEVICYANSYDDVSEIEDVVTTCLTGYTPGNVNGFTIGRINFTNESDDFVKEHNLFVKVLSFESTGLIIETT